MKRLVECGLSIDVCEGRFEQTPAHLAAFAGHANVLHWLLQNGAVAEKVVSCASYDKLITIVWYQAYYCVFSNCLLYFLYLLPIANKLPLYLIRLLSELKLKIKQVHRLYSRVFCTITQKVHSVILLSQCALRIHHKTRWRSTDRGIVLTGFNVYVLGPAVCFFLCSTRNCMIEPFFITSRLKVHDVMYNC